MMPEIVIDETTPNDLLFDPAFARGAVPRDFAVDPPEMFAAPAEMKLIPRSEWSARIKEMAEQKSRLSDLLKGRGIKPLDQKDRGYCWSHSTTMAIMATRARANQPDVRLSAYAVACVIKGYRDEGGWCGLSAKFIAERGVPSVQAWPECGTSRSSDIASTWADAAKYKSTIEWRDLTRQVWDTPMPFDAVMTCLLNRVPVAADFNHWAHSVCLLDPVEVEPGSFGVRLINSWGEGWSDQGYGVLRGSKAIPDAAVAIVSSTLS